MKLFFCLLLCVSSASIFAQKSELQSIKGRDYGIMYNFNDSLQFETYPLTTGWGYKLYYRYKLLFNQPIIPAIAGNKPFKSEEDAKKIAKLASSKIVKGQMPPTLEVIEIKNLLKLK